MNNFSAWIPSNPIAAGIVLLRSDGKVYNQATEGWDDLPLLKVPPSANVIPMTKPLDKGPLRANWFASFPDIGAKVDNVSACIVSLDASGNAVDQLDAYPTQWVNYNNGTRGGFMRIG